MEFSDGTANFPKLTRTKIVDFYLTADIHRLIYPLKKE